MRAGDSCTLLEGRRDLNLGTAAALTVVLAFSFETRLERRLEETVEFLRAGISFGSID
jgi:hypothetical protein